MGWAGLRIELGQAVFSSYDTAGVLRAQHDGLGAAPLVGSSEVIYPLGLVSRAPAAKTGPDGKPLDGGGCKVFVVYDGTEYRILYLGDHRDSANIPPLPEEGGTALHAPGCPVPSFYKIESKDGTHQIYVEIGDSSHVITVGHDGNGKPILELAHRDGMAVTMLERSLVLRNAAGDAYIEINDGGIVINGNVKVHGALEANGAKLTPTGDVQTSTGVSLMLHNHLSAMGPTSPPVPTPTP